MIKQYNSEIQRPPSFYQVVAESLFFVYLKYGLIKYKNINFVSNLI
jgi:hypothetical protein